MTYVWLWLRAFVLTCAIEVPIVTYALRAREPSVARRAALAFFANLASHPIVWFVFPEMIHGTVPLFSVVETWAVVSEAIFFFVAFRGVSVARAFAVSAIANGVSFGVGLLLTPWLEK